MITLQNIYKSFYTKKEAFKALSDINLSIKRGEIFGVFGKSGAGKSTLLRCINLLERPTSGHVFINKIDLTTLNDAQLREQRHKMGMIFQHFNLLSSRTAGENIRLPLELLKTSKEKANKRVDELLKLVGLESKKDRYPNELSGGQKQRVAIARALAAEPDILLCDEATSSLDSESTRNILKLLKDINKKLGLTIFLITHELDIIKKNCDYTAVLDQGEIIEKGKTIEIFSNPKHPITKRLIALEGGDNE